jgi:hypothetical protein
MVREAARAPEEALEWVAVQVAVAVLVEAAESGSEEEAAALGLAAVELAVQALGGAQELELAVEAKRPESG